MTRRVEKSIVVNVPREAVYEQWTHFEEFPEFMQGVQEVRQVDDRRLHWVVEVGNRTKEYDAEIVRQARNEEISWRSVSGAPNEGTVRFRSVSPHESEVNLIIEYEPEGALESIASMFGAVSSRIDGDLRRFKEYVESRHSPVVRHMASPEERFTDVEIEARTGETTGGALPSARQRDVTIREASSVGVERTQPMRHADTMPDDEGRRMSRAHDTARGVGDGRRERREEIGQQATLRDQVGQETPEAESGTFPTEDAMDSGAVMREVRESRDEREAFSGTGEREPATRSADPGTGKESVLPMGVGAERVTGATRAVTAELERQGGVTPDRAREAVNRPSTERPDPVLGRDDTRLAEHRRERHGE